ncbi:MAG: hypothetical protein KF808_04855 [Cryobacterium sp.]|nr:hypothetical protein [Cryobacterium sp.]
MAKDADEEALTWAGDSDPTHVSGKPAVAGAASVKVSGGGSSLSPVLLILFGIIAGVYLLYAIGWGINAFTHSLPVAGVLPQIMYQLGEFLAIVSPALWALAGWVLLKKTPFRLLWLFVGVILLAPWPFIIPG